VYSLLSKYSIEVRNPYVPKISKLDFRLAFGTPGRSPACKIELTRAELRMEPNKKIHSMEASTSRFKMVRASTTLRASMLA
jgi:hypothetical protein